MNFGSNPYGGYPYQNNNYYGAGYPNPAYQPPVQQTPSNTNKLYVNGVEDVRLRNLPNNSDYIFLDNDKPLIYRKTTDSTGKMSIETFKIVPYEPEIPTQNPEIDLSQYVLKKDFEALKKEIIGLRDSIKTPQKKAKEESL